MQKRTPDEVRREHSSPGNAECVCVCVCVCVCDLHAHLSLHSLPFYHFPRSARAPITLRCAQVEGEEGAMRNTHRERHTAEGNVTITIESLATKTHE